ncbi:MAG: family 16 glycosylhydrolase [Planctomycetaceae bacterium]|nr:family 16 glycosylhydrolase [Planctomycetaceae bacterium]
MRRAAEVLKLLLTLAVVLIALAAAVAPAQTTTTAKLQPYGDASKQHRDGWEFIAGQSDEFTGSAIDRTKWNIDPEDWGVWSWAPENVSQREGSLHLEIKQKTHQRGQQELYYVSGMAKNEKTITYGYFEARVKGCSRYPGACPAFWLYSRGADNRYQASDGETVRYAEIDVIELQQSEYDFETKKHFPVTHIDCNLHATLIRNGEQFWVRPNAYPELCKTAYDTPWDPRDDYHVYAVHNTPAEIVWYIDGKEVGRKPNLYWHLPMHVTLSLGLRYPFSAYTKEGQNVPVAEQTTTDGFPTTMSVDYVRVWQHPADATKQLATDWTKTEFIAREKVKWSKNGWTWNQSKVESNFAEIDTDNDGMASGTERQAWYAKKAKN